MHVLYEFGMIINQIIHEIRTNINNLFIIDSINYWIIFNYSLLALMIILKAKNIIKYIPHIIMGNIKFEYLRRVNIKN